MAEKKNVKTGKSRSAASASSSSRSKKALEEKRRREEALKKSRAQRRVISVVLFAVGLLLSLLTVIPGSEGWFAIHSGVLGLFGIPALTVGIFTIASAVMISTDMTKAQIRANIIFLVIIQIVACAAFEIFPREKLMGENFGEVVANLWKNGSEFAGGGFFALFLGVPLLLLGKTGAVIAIIIIILVVVLLVIKIPIAELFKSVGSGAKKVGRKTAAKIKTHREESAAANEEYKRIQAERRAEREIQKQVELNEKQRRIEALKNIENSVGTEAAAAPEQKKKLTSPVKLPPSRDNSKLVEAQSEDSKNFRKSIEKYRGKNVEAVEEQPDAPAEKAREEATNEQIRDYREPLKKYMEKKHPILRKPYEPNPDSLVDNDADLVPLADALDKLNAEKTPARVSKIVDAPVSKRTSSDVNLKPSAVSERDEAEIAFDLDDIAKVQTIHEPMEVAHPMQPAAEQPRRAEPLKPAQLTLSEVYTIPPVTLLDEAKKAVKPADIEQEIRLNADKLVNTLKSFGVSASYMGAARGPSVTRYELQPAPGVKLSKIAGLADDIALNLAVSGIRIAPVPDKAAVGIEIPNKIRDMVFFRELVDNEGFKKTFSNKLDTVLGKDISGEAVRCNVSKMPHLLIAGTTGSGKSVCVNSIIMSILMKSTPEDVRLIMVDPKQVEFMMYNGIPHLLIPVVTDPKKAAGALAWSVTEMDNRYTLFSENNVRNIDGYNELIEKGLIDGELMPRIVIFIDELADLMMASPKDVEDSIVRLAQKARAAGMHLVIATQKPTVQVVTGLIKGNIPSRIALMVASQIDSRVILDASGAEKLLGNGDMLYMPVGVPKPIRLQGCYVSDEEVERVVNFIKQTSSAVYDESIIADIERRAEQNEQQSGGSSDELDDGEADEKLEEAIEFVVTAGQASTSALQRRLKLGYGRAARLIDTMEKMGIVGAFEGSKPRQVLMTRQEWYERKLRIE